MAAVKKQTFVGPRYSEWAWNMALDGGGTYDDESKTWSIPIEWEDSVDFPELKGVSTIYVKEDRGEVFVSPKPF